MKYKVIDMQTWPRKDYFNYFTHRVPLSYSVTVKIDITPLMEEEERINPAMIYCITSVMNRHEEFKLGYNEKGEVIVFDHLIPQYTFLHEDDHTFSSMWTKFKEPYSAFLKEYEKDQRLYAKNKGLFAKRGSLRNLVIITELPWLSFDCLNLNFAKSDEQNLSPMVSMGKYYKDGDRWLMPLAIQVSHACCDGFHVGRFVDELQQLINSARKGRPDDQSGDTHPSV